MIKLADWQRETANVLAAMLTENTGRHILDSGDAYGRNWERNAGKDADAFFNEPEATISAWKGRYDYHTLSVFHHLLNRLEYDKGLDTAFHEFAAESGEPWFADMESWLESQGIKFHTYNSYNGEDCLSQVIQWCDWRDEYEDSYVLLQIHGGADVRGGYSSGHVFKVTVEGLGYDNADGELYCTNTECEWAVDIRGGDVTDRDGVSVDDGWQGDSLEDSELDQRVAHCPRCNSRIEVVAPYAG